MSIFVTGGTGFIGRYVIRYLVNRGEEIHLIVREPEKIALAGVERAWSGSRYPFDLLFGQQL